MTPPWNTPTRNMTAGIVSICFQCRGYVMGPRPNQEDESNAAGDSSHDGRITMLEYIGVKSYFCYISIVQNGSLVEMVKRANNLC